MNGDEFDEELWRENLYYVYKEEAEKLQKRIEKAIEYINQFIDYIPKQDKAFDILKILKGEEEKI